MKTKPEKKSYFLFVSLFITIKVTEMWIIHICLNEIIFFSFNLVIKMQWLEYIAHRVLLWVFPYWVISYDTIAACSVYYKNMLLRVDEQRKACVCNVVDRMAAVLFRMVWAYSARRYSEEWTLSQRSTQVTVNITNDDDDDDGDVADSKCNINYYFLFVNFTHFFWF